MSGQGPQDPITALGEAATQLHEYYESLQRAGFSAQQALYLVGRAGRINRGRQALSHEKLPEFVYLISVKGEWPVSAIADDHPTTAERVEAEVKRRTRGARPPRSTTHAHVWKARLADILEVDLEPAVTMPARLSERTPQP